MKGTIDQVKEKADKASTAEAKSEPKTKK
jgi:hypothetical protein